MSKAICKGVIYEYAGELKCFVPNKPVVIVMPAAGGTMFHDGGYAGGELQVNEFAPDTRWFKTKEVDGELEMMIYNDGGIEKYIREITGIKNDAEKKLAKIKKIVEE